MTRTRFLRMFATLGDAAVLTGLQCGALSIALAARPAPSAKAVPIIAKQAK